MAQNSEGFKLTQLQSDVLRTLRVFGPCSNAEVARKLEVNGVRTYIALSILVSHNLADHPKKQQWDITRLGRRYFSSMPMKKPEINPCTLDSSS